MVYTDANALGVWLPSAVASVGPNGGNRYRKTGSPKNVTLSEILGNLRLHQPAGQRAGKSMCVRCGGLLGPRSNKWAAHHHSARRSVGLHRHAASESRIGCCSDRTTGAGGWTASAAAASARMANLAAPQTNKHPKKRK